MDKIIVSDITKVYKMYNTPLDRLREAFSLSGKCYHTEFYALSNVNFRVAEGEIVGIMGRNGAGKSTLLKIITGVLSPSCGTVSLSGRVSSLLELGAGFNMEYTGMENIFFYGTIMGLTRTEVQNKVEDIIAFAEIGDYIHQPVKTYSSGMFARLAFSCAINVEPEVLIVDEILSVGDIRFQAKCFKKFKEFKEKGVTILYVGHDIGTMRTFCDRCIWLNQGRIVDEGDPTYISAKYVEYMYLDDIESFTEYRAYGKDVVETTEETAQSQDVIADVFGNTAHTPPPDEEKQLRIDSGKPLAHWGRRIGLLRDVRMHATGISKASYDPMEEITVSFSLPHCAELDYKNLSAAFSIKNREGVDLIVQTTYDEEIVLTGKPGTTHTFQFTFQPRLANGDYYLVVALEDRTEAVIAYYEYIEGAAYFKIFRAREHFGQFLPDINTTVEGEAVWKK